MLARFINTLLGLWLMTSPALLHDSGAARINDEIVGPLVASFAIIAMAEVTRSIRWLNFILGLWLIVAPWLFHFPRMPRLNSLVVGICISTLALIRGKISTRMGGGWRSLWRSTSILEEAEEAPSVSKDRRHDPTYLLFRSLNKYLNKIMERIHGEEK